MKVLVFGTFDGLHPGHIYFLDQAKKLGDNLVVVLSRDETVQKLKNHRPKFSLEERAEALAKKGIANQIDVDDEDLGSWKILKKHKPDIVVLGYDQVALGESLENSLRDLDWNLQIEVINALNPEVNKSSLLNK